MSNETQLMETIKMMGAIISDLTKSISPLPHSIATLTQTVPRMEDVKLLVEKMHEATLHAHKTELANLAKSKEIEELEKTLVALTADVISRIQKIEDIYGLISKVHAAQTEQTKIVVDAEKQKLALQETIVKEKHSTERAKMDYRIKLIGALVGVGAAVGAAIQFVIPWIQALLKK